MKGTVTQVPAAIWSQLGPCSMHPAHGESRVGAAPCPALLPTGCHGMLHPQRGDTQIHRDERDLGT